MTDPEGGAGDGPATQMRPPGDAICAESPSAAGDGIRTARRRAGDEPATRRRRRDEQVACPTCRERFYRTSLTRHRRRAHPQVRIDSLEEPNERIHIRTADLTVLKIAQPCRKCSARIVEGTPLVNLDHDPLARRKWAHRVCPVDAGGQAPQTPEREREKHPHGSGVTPTPVGPFPTPGSPSSPATPGDAILRPEQLQELGILDAQVGGEDRVILRVTKGHADELLRRLVGGELGTCLTCRDTRGMRVVMPKAYLRQHDLEEHWDLWQRGRGLAELEATSERVRKRGGMPALPGAR